MNDSVPFPIEISVKDIVNKVFSPVSDFPKHESFEIEIGTCSAHFLSAYANDNPNTFILGLEKKRKFLLRGIKNLKNRLQQDNVRLINYDAIAIIKELIPFESVDAFHVYFPDPWYKKRHNQRRTLSMENILMFANRLKKGGRIYIATDHPDYGVHIRNELYGVMDMFSLLPYGSEDRKIKTKWEQRQIAEGWKINYFLLEKK